MKGDFIYIYMNDVFTLSSQLPYIVYVREILLVILIAVTIIYMIMKIMNKR